ncbi:MAG: anthranilate synthase component II [Thermaceae bacterium]
MRVLVVDNYDSFTYNLVQYLGELSAEPIVWRNDQFTLEDVARLDPDRILISPGPATPFQAGLSIPVVQRYAPEIPILGVCLGHQAIGAAFGAEVVPAPVLMHGKVSEIHHDGTGVYRGLQTPFLATRYHSLVVDRPPQDLVLNAWALEAGGRTIMGVRHRTYPTHGVQFHPESIFTEVGKLILKNFLEDPWS